MMKNYRILAFLLLVLILETAATPESTGGDVESTGVVSSESKPDVIIKLIKRGAAERLSNSSDELPRDKRRSSSKKNKGRKVGK
ncbi:hypothetical protein GCK72_001256 [Caenorhabditis remanei]|uniref:Uncharacterized protein n=1 Tax=Caenorhabditis remanei TaxID=31234 RepID=A0A6A5HP51_CAERE|nr:hypothetical protein GCK72_001256 [Caenorhabditis remanei]KAF1769439.1 hypothetical protein GCK72_001256 [Caenorhabditis remanei]